MVLELSGSKEMIMEGGLEKAGEEEPVAMYVI